MPSITAQEYQELVLRLDPAYPALQELTARYFQVRAAQDAAERVMADPAKQTPAWKAAAEEFPQAALLYRQASDSLAALVLCGLWPLRGESVGTHILSLCDQWVDQPASRPALSRSLERIHFAMMQMGQIAADPDRPKPSDLSSSARSALEASGWGSKSKGAGASAPAQASASAKGAKSSPASAGTRASSVSKPAHPVRATKSASAPKTRAAKSITARSSSASSRPASKSAPSSSPARSPGPKPAPSGTTRLPASNSVIIRPMDDLPLSYRRPRPR